MEEKGKPYYDDRAPGSYGVAVRRIVGRGWETGNFAKPLLLPWPFGPHVAGLI